MELAVSQDDAYCEDDCACQCARDVECFGLMISRYSINLSGPEYVRE